MVRLGHLSAITAVFIASVSAGPASLVKRADSGLTCETREQCVSWYKSGYTCASGYQQQAYETHGYPIGFYCERKCTTSEQDSCAADRCQFTKGECLLYPGNTLCADAMNWCGAPMPMPESFCTRKQMGQPVVYDKETGTCAVTEAGPVEEKYVLIDIGRDTTSQRLYLTCEPVTVEGAKAVLDAVNKSRKTGYCAQPGEYYDPNRYDMRYRCDYIDTNQFDTLEKAAREACEAAAHPNGKKPVFEANRG